MCWMFVLNQYSHVQFYTVVCRVATILKTRYTAPGFWSAGLQLFLEAEKLVSESSQRKHLRDCVAQAQEQLREVDQSEGLETVHNRTTGGLSLLSLKLFWSTSALVTAASVSMLRKVESHKLYIFLIYDSGYLFEGHLTVDPEPPQPEWLVQSNLLTAVANLLPATSSDGQTENNNTSEEAANLLQGLVDRLDDIIPMVSFLSSQWRLFFLKLIHIPFSISIWRKHKEKKKLPNPFLNCEPVDGFSLPSDEKS